MAFAPSTRSNPAHPEPDPQRKREVGRKEADRPDDGSTIALPRETGDAPFAEQLPPRERELGSRGVVFHQAGVRPAGGHGGQGLPVVVAVHEGETAGYFDGCLPIEVMAERGRETLRHGPMKPVGLVDPAVGRRPWAVVQLRQDNLAAEVEAQLQGK